MTNPQEHVNPVEPYLRLDRMPHIWCPGCGIGIVVNCFVRALQKSKVDVDDVAVVSGIGCTGRIAGYFKVDSFHTTHGRPIPFATGLKTARPDMQVFVFSGEGDLVAIGGNHFIHAARRNVDIKVICVNNFTYAMTGGQVGPTAPLHSVATTAPYGAYERPFNLPFLAESCGANYVARWTTYHVRQLTKAMVDVLKKPGFCFLEVIAPCPTIYQRRNRLGDGLDTMLYYKDKSKVVNGADTRQVDIELQGEIVVGKFIDRDRPTHLEAMDNELRQKLGDKYVPQPTGVER
ncbi:MAG: 2-oxoacid:ferredoxin oxidoreductase subunit beta [Deltaproteobacteria bacterium]|nr:2-oxoacid:ferredoxin oxidoreductase subunit beta [Deltaproteobacteria bacterium]